MRYNVLWSSCLLVCSAAASDAHAFSEPTLYGDEVVNGGGGGRFFTGAPLDGFTCAVCHQGGTPPELTISGFPSRFVPGTSYDIVLSWQHPESPHALNLEVVDSDGRAAGELLLPPEDELQDDDRCILSEDEALRQLQASYLTEFGERTVVGVRGCGARRLHFSFTAPDTARVALTASVLRADGSDDPKGDGVRALRQVANRVGETARPVVGSCAAGRGGATWPLPSLVLLTLLRWRRRPRAQRS